MQQICVVSYNKGKISEFKRIFEPLKIEVKSASDLGIGDIEETGTTFEENALIKARAGFENTGIPCLADDSGLCVDAMNGAPGIFSARYSAAREAGTPYTSRILAELKDVPKEKRQAHFVACIAYIDAQGKEYVFRGECHGELALEDRGTNGHGYDPIFQPTGKPQTFAEMSMDEKNKIGHRGIAMEKFLAFLNAS